MRRWRIVLAGAALAASTFVGISPAHAANENSACRVYSNELRRELRALLPDEFLPEFNRQFNAVRNENCNNQGG